MSSPYVNYPTVPDVPTNPCIPSPCGPYSQCREVNDRAICACIDNYIGSPPACRPECSLNSECFLDKACINLKCVDPCPGACGQNARCQVINHNPICSCSSGYVGDPFISCIPEESKALAKIECINFLLINVLFWNGFLVYFNDFKSSKNYAP